MELSNAYRGTKIIEAIENYSLAQLNTISKAEPNHQNGNNLFFTDQEFWTQVILDPDKFWNKKMKFKRFVLCDWIARVPGLYWAKSSKEIRLHSLHEIAKQSRQWIELTPPGKSKKILGGIGTILLPPNDRGKRLMSISSSCNASLGVPVLIFPHVFDSLNLEKGDSIDIIDARWQPMDSNWAKRFASTQGIPRGCLIVDSPDKIKIIKKNIPFVFHPFSIMEYQKGDALLYDFVYLVVDSMVEKLQSEIVSFFDYYAKKEGRHGKYLLNPNMIQPLFETQYNSPTEMQRPSERAQLELLYNRIRRQEFKKTTLDKLIEVLPHYYDSSLSIMRLAKSVEVSQAIFQEDNAASMSAQLINYCFRENKIEELTDRMINEYPKIFNS